MRVQQLAMPWSSFSVAEICRVVGAGRGAVRGALNRLGLMTRDVSCRGIGIEVSYLDVIAKSVRETGKVRGRRTAVLVNDRRPSHNED